MVNKIYRYKLLHKMFDIFDQMQVLRENAKKAKMVCGTMDLSKGFASHLHDVMVILYDVWNTIKPEQINIVGGNQSLLITINNLPTLAIILLQPVIMLLKPSPQTNMTAMRLQRMCWLRFLCLLSHYRKPRGDNKLDEIVWEMTLAVWACKISNQAMSDLVDGWVLMEDNQQCNNILAEWNAQLMD